MGHEYPLLSELDNHISIRNSLEHSRGFVLFIGFIAGGIAALILGRMSHANCMSITVASTTPTGARIMNIDFGYVVELSHGLFYVAGVPLFALLSFYLLYHANSALRQLAAGQNITTISHEPSSPAPLTLIADRNRRLFTSKSLLLSVVAIPLVVVFGGELTSLHDRTIGWVQAPHISELKSLLLSSTKIKGINLTPVCGETPCDPRIIETHGGPREPREHVYFWIFLVLQLFIQSAFIALALWVAVKLIFILNQLAEALQSAYLTLDGRAPFEVLGRPPRPAITWTQKLLAKLNLHKIKQNPKHSRNLLKLDLQFNDRGAKRFGLACLDTVYDTGLMMGFVIAIALCLQRTSNLAKGTTFWTDHNYKLIGQLLTLAASPVLLVAILAAPAMIFFYYTYRAKSTTLVNLKTKYAPSPTLEQSDEIELARQQSPWPKGDWAFYVLVSLTVVTLLLPFGYEAPFLGEMGKGIGSLLNSLTQIAKSLCS